jgi:hypothetical protein
MNRLRSSVPYDESDPETREVEADSLEERRTRVEL